ncbi:MAG: M23 family metallopeptidase [Burkholderiaceae bacterium]|nr:MAG: M23 family metallopeptidase [Burkholderiaceae bacterium]
MTPFARFSFFLCLLLSGICAQANSAQNYPFSVETEKEGDGHRIVARNNGPAPVSVKVSIVGAQSIAPDRPFPVYAVVPPGGASLYLGRIRPVTAGVGYSFRAESTWVLGDFNAAQSPDALYRLPFKDGTAFHLGQSPGGPISTHASPDSQFAVDIPMPEGTPIVAARDGVVIYREANQVYGAQVPDMLSKANEIKILHLDGTIGVYAHLAHGGVYVYPGQRVVAGQQIGLAGSTGYSSRPHLHFVVQTVRRNGDRLETVSLPFRFYVGVPPVAFSPQFGLLAKADYSSPAMAPSPAPARMARTQPASAAVTPETAATGNPEMVISFQVPPEIRRALLKVPAWQWFAGMVGLIILLFLLDKRRTARRQREFRVGYEPSFGGRISGSEPGLSLRASERLLLACGGDRARADRLLAYERSKAPGIGDEEAALRAWECLQRDRH